MLSFSYEKQTSSLHNKKIIDNVPLTKILTLVKYGNLIYVSGIASRDFVTDQVPGLKLGADGKKIAFVRDNNLYIHDLTSDMEVVVTRDGIPNKVKSGWADWVYEEEFSKPDYFCWSNDGSHLAYVRFDETQVATYQLDFYQGQLYPKAYTFKYPKAGMQNSKVSVHVYNLNNQTQRQIDMGSDTDIYIPRLQFTPWNNQLCIQRLNRLQNELVYLLADVSNGHTTELLSERSDTYIDITDDLVFLGEDGFLRTSEQSGFNHIYLY